MSNEQDESNLKPIHDYPGLEHGTRVTTPGGPGEIVYCLRAASDASKIGCVCVILDSSLHLGYNRTIYPVREIKVTHG